MMMDKYTLVVPAEDRNVLIAEQSRTIEVPAEWFVIEVKSDASRQQNPYRR